MAGSSMRALLKAMDMRLSEVLRMDAAVGLLGAGGATALAIVKPEILRDLLPLAVGLVGVVIGTVVAGIAIQAAFFDGPFLRKLKAIGYRPDHFLGPLLITAVLGVAAALLTIVALAIPDTITAGVRGPVAFLTGLAIVWTIASLVPDLAILVEFVGVKSDAAEIPDDFDAAPSPEHGSQAPPVAPPSRV